MLTWVHFCEPHFIPSMCWLHQVLHEVPLVQDTVCLACYMWFSSLPSQSGFHACPVFAIEKMPYGKVWYSPWCLMSKVAWLRMEWNRTHSSPCSCVLSLKGPWESRNSQSFMRKSVLHAVEPVFALLISRVCCLLYSWRLLSYNTTFCGSLISAQIGSQNFLQELKIQTRGQYVFYKLHKTEV